MTDSFFILGLPRSRTAWLANFMTFDGHFCYHEGMDGCHTIEQYKEKISGKGDSSTGAILVQEYFPDSKRVIILSDPQKSIEYAKRVYGVSDDASFFHLRDLLAESDGLKVRFEDINERLQEIWEYLTETPFNKDRADMLKKLNIQTTNNLDFDQGAMKSMMNIIGGVQWRG